VNEALVWIGFNLFVVAMLALDLRVFHRRPHAVGISEALLWSALWVTLALLFNLGVYIMRGSEPAIEFLTGYLIEKSLSVDNLFVFLLIFSYFGVAAVYQHKILFWGILGALVMRAVFIFMGVALIQRFHWVIYFFGALLVFSGLKLGLQKDKKIDPERNPAVKLFKRVVPVVDSSQTGTFFVRKGRRYAATRLFLVLVVVETSDLIFAVDSIPAVLAITLDPFIVYTSNVFAILGLRALYFVLAGVLERFRYLHHGLAAILTFVGLKMLLSEIYRIPVGAALAVVGGIVLLSVVASIARPPSGPPIGGRPAKTEENGSLTGTCEQKDRDQGHDGKQ
jgi:tellurite resistance protein TerC